MKLCLCKLFEEAGLRVARVRRVLNLVASSLLGRKPLAEAASLGATLSPNREAMPKRELQRVSLQSNAALNLPAHPTPRNWKLSPMPMGSSLFNSAINPGRTY